MSDDLLPPEFAQVGAQVRSGRGSLFKLKSKLREASMLVEETDLDMQKIMRNHESAKQQLEVKITLLRSHASSHSHVLTGLPLPPPPLPPANLHPVIAEVLASPKAVGRDQAPQTPPPCPVAAAPVPTQAGNIPKGVPSVGSVPAPAPAQSKVAMMASSSKCHGPKEPAEPPPNRLVGKFSQNVLKGKKGKGKGKGKGKKRSRLYVPGPYTPAFDPSDIAG